MQLIDFNDFMIDNFKRIKLNIADGVSKSNNEQIGENKISPTVRSLQIERLCLETWSPVLSLAALIENWQLISGG
jgi:hypothetical protein